MDATQVIDWSRESLRMCLVLAAAPLAAAFLAALVVGMLQTMTQMHESVVAQLPRVLVIVLVVFLILPWLLTTWVGYARGIFQTLGIA